MREGFDKEIDSLLRRHARGTSGVREDGARATGAAAHLDPDELSAFAEGALPAAARLAAVSHLADCDECRGLAVTMARASGFEVASERGTAVAAAAAKAGAPAVAGWRVWLSSLFAPRVLRYAAPALALGMIAVVSFVALRSRQGAAPSSQVALNESRQAESPKDAATAGAPVSTATANANTDGLVARSADEALRGATEAGARAPTTSSTPESARPAAKDAPASPVGATTEQPAPPTPAGRTEVASDASAASKAGAAEEREADKKAAEDTASKADENKNKSAREAEPVETVSNDQYAQKRAQSRANEAQMPDGSRNRAAGNQSNVAGGGLAARQAPKTEDRDSGESRGAATRRARKGESSGERSDDGEAARNAETRAAAGHRFRREGNAWVDVNFKSSMPSTGVRRGTEAFRALVADLPEIGRVAEQIGGEVVVVVRGRAYRIR